MLKPIARRSPLDSPEEFRESLRTWFGRHGRDYPWRRTTDPYEILVSEVMLQQTQIATVLGKGFYTRFLERFPDVESLASADDDPLLKAWEGLGYYRRARMLRESARAVLDQHGGRFPEDVEALQALPGIGRYTAGALLSFAFGKPAPVVDGNVARVFARLFDRQAPVDLPATQKWLWDTAARLLDHSHPREFNSALMEVGQTCCRPGIPDCLACPVAAFCTTREPELLPTKSKKTKTEDVDEHSVFLLKEGRLLLERQGKGRREGMWRLPLRPADELAGVPVVHRRKYGITKYRVTMHVHLPPSGHPAEAERFGEEWHATEDLDSLAIPPADREAVQAIFPGVKEIA